MARKNSAAKPPATSILDYPAAMSLYERESRAAEARLRAERNMKKEKWRGLAKQASTEPDPEKLLDLSQKLIKTFNGETRRKA